MKNKINLALFALIMPMFLHGQVKWGDNLVDSRDGKVYPTVWIGSQLWMAKNLDHGSMVHDMQQNHNQVIEKTCYQNIPANCEVYGGLYTWNEAMNWTVDQIGICPEGWHIPTRDEWTELSEYLGVDSAGQKMKVSPTHDPRWDGTNESGFTALPSGNAYGDSFGRLSHHAYYWSSTPSTTDNRYAWFSHLDNHWAPYKYTILTVGEYFIKENGFSVRCIKNK